MKKLLSLLLALTMVLALAACGGSSGSGAASTTPAATEGNSSSAPAAQTSDYPKKAITMIVPYGAGGTTDLTGRQLAIALEKQLGQSVVVENMAGASGSVGAQAVLDSDPDGYTVFFTAESLGTQRVMGISEMSYADFSPISAIGSDPKVMVVGKNSQYADIQSLLDDIKANPGKIQMSYTGPGSSGHVQALILNRFGYEPALTAYTSGSESITAVLGNQVAFTNSNYSTVASYIQSGDLKVLAVCSTEPLAALPDVPALATVIPGSESLLSIPYSPTSLIVDKDVPAEAQEVLRKAVAEAVKDADFNKFMTDNCIEKLYEKYTTIEETLKFYANWESTVSWMLFDAGATVNSPEDFNIPKP
ncbi:MAG: tripartite tricarboxylate transporter substrate binding protein [Oscillospiraceae bacterium]|nr:tripartite tricarboxylate transporter substrate binding protein [Oscillospiraceae bacterium]